MCRRPEAAPLHQDRLLAQYFAGLQHLAVGTKHRDTAQPELDEFERHQPVVHAAELDATELDHVNLDAAGGKPVKEALDEPVRLVMRLGLELHAHPAVALIAAPVAAGHHRIGKREEAVVVAALIAEPVDIELEFLVEHALEPPGGYIPVRLAVHR